MLVTDTDSGNRIGFVDGTDFVNEIDNARIIEILQEEDTGYAFYLQQGPAYDITFIGLDTGTMFVDVITPTSETEVAEIQYEDVEIEPGTVAVIENITVIEEAPQLKIDKDADGVFETELATTAFKQEDIGAVTTVGPKIELSNTELSLGQVAVNDRDTATLTILNTGDEDLVVSQITVDNEVFTLTPSSVVIAPDKDEDITVSFIPKDFGEQNASITIESKDDTLFVAVTGDGIGIIVTSPNSGEELIANSSYEITWDYRGVSAIKIEYSTDGGTTWETIATDQSVDMTSFVWTVPDIESFTSMIRISDTSVPEISDISDNAFRIIIPKISITHEPIAEAQEFEELNFTVTITSGAELENVTVYYDISGRRVFDKSADMTSTDGNEYTARIESGVFSALGLEYYIIAKDIQGNEIRIPSDSDYYSISASVQEMLSNYQIHGGSSVNAYRMISIPLSLTTSSIVDQLKGRLPTGKSGPDWRLFLYINDVIGYKEYPDIDGFSPGKAFWLIVKDEMNYSPITPEGKTVTTSEPFSLTLKPGWNDIANPWMFDITWDDMENPSGANLSVLYTYEGEWSDPTNPPRILEPWKGYAVRNMENLNVIINLQPTPVQAAEKSVITQEKEIWRLTIKAIAGDASDSANHLGVCEDAKVEWDHFDHVEPPPIGQYVSVSFPHYDWEQYPYAYTVDIRPPESTISWDFDVKTNIPRETVTVNIEGMEDLPEEHYVKLFDRDSKHAIDINNNTFSFVSGKDLTERHFMLVVSDSEEPELEEYASIPERFVTAMCFPNPFNPQTTIRYELSMSGKVAISIYNALGQQVKVYNISNKDQGVHEIVFDASDLTSGIYLYRVDAGYASVTGKMLYMK